MSNTFFDKFTIQVMGKTGDGWYLGKVTDAAGNCGLAQGRNKEEIIMMAADVILAMEEIKCSWWNRFISKLLIYRKE